MRTRHRFPAIAPGPARTRRRRAAATALLLAAVFASGFVAAALPGWQARRAADGQWTPLGSGIADGVGAGVQAVATYGDTLVVAGTFSEAGGVAVHNIAAWDGAAWSDLGGGLTSGSPVVLATFDGQLIAGGLFRSAGGVPANYLARWDGVQWWPFGEGADAPVRAIAAFGGDLIVAGEFSSIDGVAAQRIARWDGENWWPLGSGLTDGVYAGTGESLAVYGGELVVGGLFDHAGGVAAQDIARWNGAAWAPLGAGLDGTSFNRHVYTLLVQEATLLAGGSFTLAGGAPAGHLARWNGTAWTTLGTGLDGSVTSLVAYAGRVVAGGVFHAAGGAPAERIAAWDGAQWSPLGSGMDDTVRSLAVADGTLFAGGLFSQAGGAPIHFVAAWRDAGVDPVFANGFDGPAP